MSRQPQHKAELKLYRGMRIYCMTKEEKNYRKNVATQKFMSQHNEEPKAEIFVTTTGSYVVT